MKTLLILPHLDDEAISCGGLIQVRRAMGWDVEVLFVYGRVYDYGRETTSNTIVTETDDMVQSSHILGFNVIGSLNKREGEPSMVGYYEILEPVEKALLAYKPDEVVIPSATDLNQDHRFLNHVLGIALRPVNLGRVTRILEFIALDGTLRQPSYFVPLTATQVARKIEAITAYRREARGGTSPRAPLNVAAQASVWGACCGSVFAEAYTLRFAREIHESGDHRGLRFHWRKPDAVSGQDRTDNGNQDH